MDIHLTLGITRAMAIALTQVVVLLAAPIAWERGPPPPASVALVPPYELVNPITAYLALSVEPANVVAGTLITLNIEYWNVGLPHTFVIISPTGLVDFDPPLTMPCRYFEHSNGCRALTLRTRAPGVVQLNAVANGEVFDDKCGCSYFTTVSDNGAALDEIAAPASRLLLPSVYR